MRRPNAVSRAKSMTTAFNPSTVRPTLATSRNGTTISRRKFEMWRLLSVSATRLRPRQAQAATGNRAAQIATYA